MTEEKGFVRQGDMIGRKQYLNFEGISALSL